MFSSNPVSPKLDLSSTFLRFLKKKISWTQLHRICSESVQLRTQESVVPKNSQKMSRYKQFWESQWFHSQRLPFRLAGEETNASKRPSLQYGKPYFIFIQKWLHILWIWNYYNLEGKLFQKSLMLVKGNQS